jgi:hypothetical protein
MWLILALAAAMRGSLMLGAIVVMALPVAGWCFFFGEASSSRACVSLYSHSS